MGLSETILAAMIGAIATVTTALFQIFTAFRARSKADTKPKRGTALRSILAVLALMGASGAGGFLYSQLLQQRDAEDIRAMRHELRELRDLTASTIRQRDYPLADSAQQDPGHDGSAAAGAAAYSNTASQSSLEALDGSVESVVYVPACRAEVHPGEAVSECDESEAQRIALCGSVPSAARVKAIQLYAQPDAVQQPWSQHIAALDADIGGARFTGKSFEYAQGDALKAVCVNFAHWSSQHPHIARMVVLYGYGNELQPAPAAVSAPEPAPVLTQTTLTSTDGIQALPQTAAFAAPATTR